MPIAHLLAGDPQRDQTLMLWLVAIYGVFFLALVSLAQAYFGLGYRDAKSAGQIENPILVDGSNVMHWGGNPSLQVLISVLGDLKSHGYTPIVYFDANVGYKLSNAHANSRTMAQQLGLARWQVTVVPGRVVADEHLLEMAQQIDAQIVTNDRYRDWQDQFPRIGEHGFLIKGRWTGSGVIWRFPQDLALMEAA